LGEFTVSVRLGIPRCCKKYLDFPKTFFLQCEKAKLMYYDEFTFDEVLR